MSVRRSKNSVKSGRGSTAMDYKLFAMNFYGNGMRPIKEEFIAQVEDGLRKNVFVIDMEDEIHKAGHSPLIYDEHMKGYGDRTDLLQIALNAIKDRKRRYEELIEMMEKEKSFNLINYWMSLPPEGKKVDQEEAGKDAKKGKEKVKGKEKEKDEKKDKKEEKDDGKKRKSKEEKADKKKGKTKTAEEVADELGEEEFEYCPDDGPEMETFCLDTVIAEHNHVGNPESILNRRYIEDSPLPEILYFVIIGTFNKDFYVDLLNANQPLQAVINFLPEESTYDHLLQRKDNIKFIKDTLETIRGLICSFREPYQTKPTGFFTAQLPVLSPCLAKKLAQEIYAELSWYLYDIQVLLRQYYLYYINEFHEIDVALPRHVDLFLNLEKARVLEVNGHYFSEAPLVLANEVATIALYIDKLLSSVAKPPYLLNKTEIELLREYANDPTNVDITNKSKQVMAHYVDGFESITEIKRYERLYVDGCNSLLLSLIEAARKLTFPSIFRACLEYSLLRKAYVNPAFLNSLPYIPFDENLEIFELPKYVRFFSSEGSVIQRLKQLFEEYDDFDILETIPKHRLYVFRRTFNEIFDYEKQVVLPTRLCFRDFSIYQMEEFYRVLSTPEIRRGLKEEYEGGDYEGQVSVMGRINPEIFIRPNSVKATHFGEEMDIRAYGDCAVVDIEEEGGMPATVSRGMRFGDQSSDTGYVGLPPNHPMLTGYNLEDIRQKICTKDSKYYFEEGYLKLSEERWNFTLMNRSLEFNVHNCSVYLTSLRKDLGTMSKTIRIITGNDVAIRLANIEEECSKILVTYPNGLSIYYYDTYTEQRWLKDNAVNKEKKRYFTPYGAVIVYYNDNKKIVVLRYNGEVYELLQYESEEEEECFPGEDLVCEKKEKSLDRLAGGGHKKKLFSESTSSIGEDFPSSMHESLYDELRELLAFELKFIEDLARVYQLTWINLRIITTTGRVFLVPQKGLISEASPYELIEWNDYFCNESLAMRGDGVRLIWTAEYLRCYHCDGTFFETKTIDCIVDIFGLETDSNVSQSSSHLNAEYTDEDVVLQEKKEKRPRFRAVYFCDGEEVAPEIEEQEDARYIQIVTSEYLEVHTCYASVYFAYCSCFNNCNQPFMEVCGADGIRFNVEHICEVEDTLNDFLGEDEDFPQFKPEQPYKRTATITLWVGTNLYFCVTECDFEICTMLAQTSELENKICQDSMTIKHCFTTSLETIFHDMTCKICCFKKSASKTKLHYFMEKQPFLCANQGYEFLEKLPTLSDFTLKSSNTTIEFKPIVAINNRFRNCTMQRCNDLIKFPRFAEENTDTEQTSSMRDFPFVLESK